MNKWADYLISAVCKTDQDTVKQVAVRYDNGETISEVKDYFTKAAVIELIENNKTFATIYMKDGKWQRGADVHVVDLYGSKYIRTDKNRISKDNLENLPEYSC